MKNDLFCRFFDFSKILSQMWKDAHMLFTCFVCVCVRERVCEVLPLCSCRKQLLLQSEMKSSSGASRYCCDFDIDEFILKP